MLWLSITGFGQKKIELYADSNGNPKCDLESIESIKLNGFISELYTFPGEGL